LVSRLVFLLKVHLATRWKASIALTLPSEGK
jgi:hypothetical protein